MLNLTVLPLLISLVVGSADDRTSIEPITLTPGTTIETSAPGFNAMGNAQCDSKGNLFFHAVTFVDDPAILKLDRNGGLKLYRLSQDDATTTYFRGFRVHPDGRLWLLDAARGNDHKFALFAFAKDSDDATRTWIDLPSGFEFKNFLILANEHVLMQGSFGSTAAAEFRNKSAFFELDASGRVLRHSVESNSDVESQPAPDQQAADKDSAPRFPEAAVAYGDDGLNYVLQPNQVVVMSGTGQELRRVRFEAPEPGFYPTHVAVAGGRLAVFFMKPNKDHLLVARYELFDATNGNLLRVYASSDETGNNAVCFSEEGFTFLRVRNRRVVLIVAPTR